MGHRTLFIVVLSLLPMACASKPIDVACRDGIASFEGRLNRASIGGILEGQSRAAIVEAKQFEASGEFEACSERIKRARNGMYQPRQGGIVS